MADRFLVIGGTGFIGRQVVERLLAAGHGVAVFHRGHTTPDLPTEVRRVLGDRRSIADHARELQALEPRIVIDMIAYTEDEARACSELFRGVAERLVVVSSQDVYRAFERFRGPSGSPAEPVPYDEAAPLRERLFPYRGSAEGHDPWVRDYDKILVERAVMEGQGPAATILRLPMVYGPGDRQHRILPYLKRMDDGRPAILLEEGQAGWRWTRGYVGDVAAAIALAAGDDRAQGAVYNVGESDALSETGWIREIGHAAGWEGDVVAVPSPSWPASWTAAVDWLQPLVADTSRIRSELGYRDPPDRSKGLLATVAWEREKPPLLDPRQFDYEAEDHLLERLAL